MFEADSQNFASALSVPRGFTLQNFRPALIGGSNEEGGPSQTPLPLSDPPPFLIHPWGQGCIRTAGRGGLTPLLDPLPLPPWAQISQCEKMKLQKEIWSCAIFGTQTFGDPITPSPLLIHPSGGGGHAGHTPHAIPITRCPPLPPCGLAPEALSRALAAGEQPPIPTIGQCPGPAHTASARPRPRYASLHFRSRLGTEIQGLVGP